MRAPRCYIRYLTAAVKAQSELQLAQYRRDALARLDIHDGDEHLATLVLAVRDRTAELEEHISNCEECETP